MVMFMVDIHRDNVESDQENRDGKNVAPILDLLLGSSQ